MGTQIAFFATSEDLLEVILTARQAGASGVTELIPLDDPVTPCDPELLLARTESRKFYLLPGELAPVEVFPIEIPNRPGIAKVNVLTSPVVEILPARLESGTLNGGRFFLGLSPSDSRYRPARRLFDSLKRAVEAWERTRQSRVPVGPRAAEGVRRRAFILQTRGERFSLPPLAPP